MATLIIVKYIVWSIAWALSLLVKKMNAKEIKKTVKPPGWSGGEKMTALSAKQGDNKGDHPNLHQ
ncbi:MULTISPECIES: hypothetical protein [unclassified Rahnella]|uniref:hypothetical protein n=1 Tax=unclassified Rahnella TaxID=2635087 RepID=UPI000560CE89|nr:MULTISPECIES: hypothetical protein [unclassified Rahnella]MQB56229.1 hypothetical protein [Rahnella sp. RcJ3]